MEPLTFIAKMIGGTARIGAAVAIGAGLLVILRWMKVEPFISIEASTYGTILIAGIIGAGIVVVELIIAIWVGVKRLWSFQMAYLSAKAKNRQKQETALKNLQAAPAAFVETLRFLKAKNSKRFAAPSPRTNDLLHRMEQSFLIEIDDPNYGWNVFETYYRVPDDVWDWMERNEPTYQRVPLAKSAPWRERA
ncbi:MAG: hypothetical protein WBW81_08080 [Methylocella sp.]